MWKATAIRHWNFPLPSLYWHLISALLYVHLHQHKLPVFVAVRKNRMQLLHWYISAPKKGGSLDLPLVKEECGFATRISQRDSCTSWKGGEMRSVNLNRGLDLCIRLCSYYSNKPENLNLEFGHWLGITNSSQWLGLISLNSNSDQWPRSTIRISDIDNLNKRIRSLTRNDELGH